MKYCIVYEPRVQDPITVAEFDSQEQAKVYMKDLESKRPQTYKFCQIVEKGWHYPFPVLL